VNANYVEREIDEELRAGREQTGTPELASRMFDRLHERVGRSSLVNRMAQREVENVDAKFPSTRPDSDC
jgi:hypothetical protein